MTMTRSNTRYSEALSLKPDDNVVMSVGGESSSTTTNRGKVTMIDVERWRVNLNRERIRTILRGSFRDKGCIIWR